MKFIYILIYFLYYIYYCNSIILPNKFNVLGPFPTSEREEGIDSIRYYTDDLFNSTIDITQSYPSELGNEGKVSWNSYAPINNAYSTSLSVDFNEIPWDFLEPQLSWSVYMWYGYAVGDLVVPENTTTNTFIVSCTGVIHFYIVSNDQVVQEFIGDLYSYGSGQQLAYLPAGNYKVWIRLQSSVRQFLSPHAAFNFTIQEGADQSIFIIHNENLVPSVVDGYFAGTFGSITILNIGTTIISSIDLNTNHDNLTISTNQTTLNILPGQKYQIIFSIQQQGIIDCSQPLDIFTSYSMYSTNITLNCTTFGGPYSFTYLDFDQTLQYAVAYPPSSECGLGELKCNLLLATHGAGVEVILTPGWYNAYPQQPDMWILFVTGRRPWNYDWQSTSRVSIFYAINALQQEMTGVPPSLKSSYALDSSKILFSGHSMGSYGCFSLLTHFGDMAIGGACAAGFAKLEEYVYYNTRPSFERIDPILKGLFMASIAESDVDLYSTSLVGIPIIIRYGENDTVVSPWHSRRVARLISENSGNTNSVMISEIPNEGHWFSSMLDDPIMSGFYSNVSLSRSTPPPIPDELIIVTNNPASSGSRANINILQTMIPSRVARISIKQSRDSNGLVWTLTTQNVKRFGFINSNSRELPYRIILDKMEFDTAFLPDAHFVRTKKTKLSSWKISDDQSWQSTERTSLTYGPMRQIFEKPYTIIYGTLDESLTSQMESSALYISNYFNTYGRGSPMIYSDTEYIPNGDECDENTNYIFIGNSFQNLYVDKYQQYMPIQFGENNSFTISQEYEFDGDAGIGISFLSPNQCGKGLFLVIAGTDSQGLSNALHSIPQRSGVTVPDFLIINKDWVKSGLSSTIATGFWDNHWKLSLESSYISLH